MTQDGRDSAASHIGKSLGPASRDRTEGTAPLQSQFVTVEAKVEAKICQASRDLAMSDNVM